MFIELEYLCFLLPVPSHFSPLLTALLFRITHQRETGWLPALSGPAPAETVYHCPPQEGSGAGCWIRAIWGADQAESEEEYGLELAAQVQASFIVNTGRGSTKRDVQKLRHTIEVLAAVLPGCIRNPIGGVILEDTAALDRWQQWAQTGLPE